MTDVRPAIDPRVADLVQSGNIRVALYLPQYTKDPVTGELRGWCVELVRALGERIGVAGVPVEHPTPPAAIAALKSCACDAAILGIDPARTAEADYHRHLFSWISPASCRRARRSTVSPTWIGPAFASRSCAITSRR